MAEQAGVLIVGAGPTGMSAAMELSRMRVPVRIVDKLVAFSDTSRALAVQARTMELMDQRGLAAEMLRLGNRGRRAVLHGDGKKLGAVDLSLIESRYNFILLLAQSETERLLREQLGRQGVAVERGTELVAVSQHGGHGGGVTAVLRKGDGSLEEVRAAYLIDASGAHSPVRHTLNLPFTGTSLPHSYALADLHADGPLPEDALSIFVARSGLLAAFPLGNRRFRVIATEPDATPAKEYQKEHAPVQQDPSLDDMQRLWNQGASVSVRMRDMIWSSRFRINSRMVPQLRAGRLFLGGDAAHVHSPAGGQGMNTGIQDMINLSWKLAMVYHGVAQNALLDTYGEERLPVIRQLVNTTEKATDVVGSGSKLIHAMVEGLAPLLLHAQAVETTAAGAIGEVAIGYRGSSLNGMQRGSGSAKVGDRVPDLPVLDGGEEPAEQDTAGRPGPVRLLDRLDPSRFTLLLLGEAKAPLELATSALANGWLTVRRVDGMSLRQHFGSSQWMLVRPDGYLLMRGKGEEAGALRRWTGCWLAARG